jgi:hypothetical protein
MKVGDLVTWTEKGDKIFNNYYSFGYKSPGIILEVSKRTMLAGTIFHTFEIYWADGATTTEHSCYIRKVEE